MLNETLRNSSVSDPCMRKSADSHGTAGFIVSCRRARIGDDLFKSLLFNNFNGELRPFSGKTDELTSRRKRKQSEAELE